MSEEQTQKCAHTKYKAHVKVTMTQVPQLGVGSLIALVTMKCQECGKDFVWKGRPGFSTSEPHISPDMLTLRAPLLPPPDEEIEDIVLPAKIEKRKRKIQKKKKEEKTTLH